MNKVIEASGKTVKEAIQNGAAELGCTVDEVEAQIIDMGSTGLFGMFAKPAKVRLTLKEEDHSFDIEMPVFTLDQPEKGGKKPAKEKKERKAAPAPKAVEEKPAAPVESEAEPKPEKKERKPRARKERKEQPREGIAEPVTVAAPAEPAEPFVETAEEQLSETARRARDFLKGLTEHMGVPAEIAVCESEAQLRMQLSGENMSILIGRRGETLDALQYLTSLVVNKEQKDYVRVKLDTENYRKRRKETLENLARNIAYKVKKTRRPVSLEPMNPYERRIIHSALQGNKFVETYSEGSEPYRHVVVAPKR